MNYTSLAQEWDETYSEMSNFHPEVGDKILCLCPDVQAGEVVEVKIHEFNDVKSVYYVVRLEDGSTDEFAEEDVLKRKTPEEVAA